MCGITACISTDDVVDTLTAGLSNLEYRGYDSAGIAVHGDDGLAVRKRSGGIDDLHVEDALASSAGIGHTRWSTHGPPTDENAHPHTDCTGRVTVAHNGIIENYAELRAELSAAGHEFTSDTDTEVVPHLIEDALADGLSPQEAFLDAIDRLDGSYALVMMTADEHAIYAARNGSPLVLGVGDGQHFLASDVPSFLEFTSRVVYLEDGDVARVGANDYTLMDTAGEPLMRPVETVEWAPEDAERDGYAHYMLKEINEQPVALERALSGRIDGNNVQLDALPDGSLSDVSNVHFVACGTSYHAALYAQQLLADRGVPSQVFSAGEYATTPAPLTDRTLVVGVTQSGETADTLESLRNAADRGARTLAVTNVVGSTAARECDDTVFLRAGPEIGVAATKTFSSQVAVLTLLTERLVEDITGSPSADRAALLQALERLPADVETVLDQSGSGSLAHRYHDREGHFFLGRGIGYPVALEGALKFKEITYKHAEGFAAGELKHGPLALVTDETPVFVVFTGQHTAKTLNNVKEVQARGAPVIGIASDRADDVANTVEEVLSIPDTHPDVAGVLANVQLQLVSYHVADLLDRAIDKPRNLAKSVTVE